MAGISQDAVTVVGAASIVILGYFLNGWRERSFERKRTNYHSKLRAFREINQACQDLTAAYAYWREASQWDTEKADLQELVASVVVMSSFSQDLEKNLGTSICRNILDDYRKIRDQTNDEATREWADDAVATIVLLTARLARHSADLLMRAGDDAFIVSEEEAVQHWITVIRKKVKGDLQDLPEVPMKTLLRPDFAKFSREIAPYVTNLQDAMRHELNLTMLSSIGQHIYRYRNGLKNGVGKAEDAPRKKSP